MENTKKTLITTRQEIDRLIAQDKVPKVVWCYWAGGPMNDNRLRSFDMMQQYMEVPLCLVTHSNINQFLVDGHPLHNAFNYLSTVHQSDYFRIYLLHHFGGAWHDIKPVNVSYLKAFNEFNNPDVFLVGKPEIKGGPAKVYDEERRWMPDHWPHLVATNRWIARANTPFSNELYSAVNNLLDEKIIWLEKFPARHPYDKKKKPLLPFLPEKKNQYPLPWTLFGNLFHPLNFKYRQNISRNLPFDNVENLGLPYR